MANLKGDSSTHSVPGIVGVNTAQGDGVWGQSDDVRGVVGVSNTGSGAWGHTVNGRAVVGVNNEDSTGVCGETKKAVACGGCYYPVDSVPMTPQDWQQHFSEQWCTFAAAKQAFDPNHLLSPQQGIFDLTSVSESLRGKRDLRC